MKDFQKNVNQDTDYIIDIYELALKGAYLSEKGVMSEGLYRAQNELATSVWLDYRKKITQSYLEGKYINSEAEFCFSGLFGLLEDYMTKLDYVNQTKKGKSWETLSDTMTREVEIKTSRNDKLPGYRFSAVYLLCAQISELEMQLRDGTLNKEISPLVDFHYSRKPKHTRAVIEKIIYFNK